MHLIQFKCIKNKITLSVTRKDLSTIFKFGTKEEGSFAVSVFVKGSKRGDFLEHIFQEAIPDHFSKH